MNKINSSQFKIEYQIEAQNIFFNIQIENIKLIIFILR
jgi:hypothetical protein